MRWDEDYKNPEVINDPTIIPAYGVTDEERAYWNNKQDPLQYDAEPTPYSDNHLISGAIYNALQAYKVSTVTLCQEFYWGIAGGLAETREVVDRAAETAVAAQDRAIAAQLDAAESKGSAETSAANAAGSAYNAALSKSDAAGSAAMALADAENSEAWAVGTRHGQPVSSNDPAYHNNSKYYADLGSEVIQDDQVSEYTTWSSNKLFTDFAAKADLVSGKVPAAQLPGYVDDVIEGYLYEGAFYEDAQHTELITGEQGKLYVDISDNKTYRWSGSAYVLVSDSLALGEVAGTAYEGSKGKTNATAIAMFFSYLPSNVSILNQLVAHSDIPTTLASFTDDALHRTVTDTEKTTWDNKAPGVHTHDDRYYTETEIDNKFNGVTFTTSNNEIYINW